MSNSSEIYMSQPHGRPVSIPMALNGSNFGATSALDYAYDDKDTPDASAPAVTAAYATTSGYDYNYSAYGRDQHASGPMSHQHPGGGQSPYDGEDYTSFPPPVGMQPDPSQGGVGAGLYESDSEGDHVGRAGAGGVGKIEGPPVYRV